MSELEKEELTRRINGMSDEEKKLAASLLPEEIIVDEVQKRFDEQENKESHIVWWSIRSVTTKKVFPKTFKTQEMAEAFRKLRPNPEHWEVVKQEVSCGNWKNG